MGQLASTLLADEERAARNPTAATAITPAEASNTHIEYLSAELVGAERALLPFFRFMRLVARAERCAATLRVFRLSYYCQG
jgi:hypothetical protein